MKIKYILLFSAAVGLLSSLSFSQDRLTQVLEEELLRNFNYLQTKELPPYYISARVNDIKRHHISAVYGEFARDRSSRERVLHTSLRVGNYGMDNTREIRDDRSSWFRDSRRVFLSIDDNEATIKRTLWSSIDESYKDALSKYNQVQANIAVKVEQDDDSDDFSKESKLEYFEDRIAFSDISFDREKWIEKLETYSGIFLQYPVIYDAQASLSFEVERRNFVSSEGSKFEENRTAARLFVRAKVKADDGMVLPLHTSYFAFLPENLPSDDSIIADIINMAELLVELREAPIAEAYAGPALLSGEAAGVFFHEIFGHRIEGHRLKLSTDGQTFKNSLNERVLPEHLSVVFNPQLRNYLGEDMYGYYAVDDQGVKGQKVNVVENGILRNFLMSRTPIEDFPVSNGHGRAAAGNEPVSRQSNMLILTDNPISKNQLFEEFKKELEKQNKEFGFYFHTVSGGFTTTGRFMPNAFNVSPLVVYKVFVDGREKELIRGVDLIGTPLAMFSQIKLAADDYGFFHGNCGAESGWVPVTAVSPSLMVTQIETQRQPKSQDRDFILPAPGDDN